jgi:hypothetical protein
MKLFRCPVCKQRTLGIWSRFWAAGKQVTCHNCHSRIGGNRIAFWLIVGFGFLLAPLFMFAIGALAGINPVYWPLLAGAFGWGIMFLVPLEYRKQKIPGGK